MTRYIMLVALLIAFAALSLVATASPPIRLEINVDDIKLGSKIKALRSLPLRKDAPKQGLIYIRQQRTGTVLAEEILTVTGEKWFKNLLGNQKWLEVKRETKPDNGEPITGWIYVGDEGEKSCCLEFVP